MRLLEGQSDHVAAFIAMQIPECFPDPKELHPFGVCDGVGFMNDQGRLVGGMIFYAFNMRAKRCEIAAACIDPKGLTPRLLRDMLSRPFRLGVNKVCAYALTTNERSLRNTMRMGFRKEAIIPNHFGDGKDAQLSALYREDFEVKYERT